MSSNHKIWYIPTTIKKSTKLLQYCLYKSKYETCNAYTNCNLLIILNSLFTSSMYRYMLNEKNYVLIINTTFYHI